MPNDDEEDVAATVVSTDAAEDLPPCIRSSRRRVRPKYLNSRSERALKNMAIVGALAQQGMSTAAIAREIGLHPVSVRRYRKQVTTWIPALKKVNSYRAAKADLIEAAESTALKSVVFGLRQKDARLGEKVMAFRELTKAARLEQGKSTENHAHKVQFSEAPLPTRKPSK